MKCESGQIPDWLDVSRETLAKLEDFLELVAKWNPRINLVSAGSLEGAWQRHVLDSAQLWGMVRATDGIWLDIGSGAGFPGIVISILAQQSATGVEVVLVESDLRKAVFLREVVRQLGLKAVVHSARIEKIAPVSAKFISARALAGLGDLLRMVDEHQGAGCVSLFLKGQGYAAELDQCRRDWSLECEAIPSKTDPRGAVLKIWDVRHG